MARIHRKTMREVYEDNRVADAEEMPVVRPNAHKPPEFPNDLTRIAHRKLGELHSEYAAFMVFVNERMAQYSSKCLWAKIRKQREMAKIVFASGGTKLKQISRVRMDPGYQKVERDWFAAVAELNAWKNFMWSIKGCLEAVEYETQRRHYGFKANLGNGGRPVS